MQVCLVFLCWHVKISRGKIFVCSIFRRQYKIVETLLLCSVMKRNKKIRFSKIGTSQSRIYLLHARKKKSNFTLYCIFKAIEKEVAGYKLLPFVYANKKGENLKRIFHRISFILRHCMKVICHHFCTETSISCCTKSIVINGNPYVNSYSPDTDQTLIFIPPNLLLFSEF